MHASSSAQFARRLLWQFAVPLAAFAAGWHLRPASPAGAPSTARTIQVRPQQTAPTAAVPPTASDAATAAGTSAPLARLAAQVAHAATLDATGALAGLKALDLQPDGPENRIARHILLARFAELDPATALTYVDTLPAAERTDATLTAMNAWATRDPAAAAAHLESEAGGFGLSSDASALSAGRIASAWAASDPAAAAGWATGLDEELRGEALAGIARSLAATTPSAATAFLATLTDPAEHSAAAREAALGWAQSDPQAAAAWARTSTTTSAAAGVVTAWMLRDPAAASQWVDSLPAGSRKDAAIVALTQSAALRNDAASAAAWAATIQDESVRAPLLAAARRIALYQGSPE